MKSDKVAILTKKIALEFERLSNPALQEYNLTGAQYKILMYLFRHQDKQVRQVDLEKYFSLTHPTTIGLLEQLEKKGFVRRQRNPRDARSRIVILTEQSVRMQEELEQMGDSLEKRLTAALTEEERLLIVGLLQKLLSEFE